MVTGTPVFTIWASFTMSQLAKRMQPWLTLRPIASGLSLPWMPTPFLSSAIQDHTDGTIRDPGGGGETPCLRSPSLSIFSPTGNSRRLATPRNSSPLWRRVLYEPTFGKRATCDWLKIRGCTTR